jgi:hypothetical protein
MKTLIIGLTLLGLAQSAAALDANQVRGGWETTIDGVEHVYELRIVGDRISGAYCTACDDATTLAFVDGRLSASGLDFTVTHVRDDGSTRYQDRVHAQLQNGQLIVQGRSGLQDGGTFAWTMHRDPRGVIPPGPPAPVVHYLQPGPWEPITANKLVGVWLSGAGANKQYFIIRRDGNALRGMVCGPCDNPYSMAAMEDFYIQGDTVTWHICHEDHGVGPLPYAHEIIAHVADHELHLDATQPNMQRTVSMTFLGPLPVEATARAQAGNAGAQTASGAEP